MKNQTYDIMSGVKTKNNYSFTNTSKFLETKNKVADAVNKAYMPIVKQAEKRKYNMSNDEVKTSQKLILAILYLSSKSYSNDFISKLLLHK